MQLDRYRGEEIHPSIEKGKPMEHAYTSHITWTGNQGTGTSGYKALFPTWDIAVKEKNPFIVQMIHYWAAIPAK
jgi:hypothetical protein